MNTQTLTQRRAIRAYIETQRLRQPEPANFCAPDDAKPEPFSWIDSAVFLTPMAIVSVLILIARWMGWLS